jgi:hypothetical protein
MMNGMKYAFAIVLALSAPAWADIVKLKDGEKLQGQVIKESDTEVVIRVGYGLVTLDRRDVESIEKTDDQEPAPPASTSRLPSWKSCVQVVFAQAWITQFLQIPATVIDKGILKHVPYKSFKSGNYEFNVYGDPDHPACIEVGITKDLLKNPEAKQRCLDVMSALFSNEEDKAVLKSLDRAKDKKERDGLTFEITPETAADAYGGWWVSVYDVKALDAQRATEKELKEITVVKPEKAPEAKPPPQPKPDPAPTPPKPKAEDRTSWSWNDYVHARVIQNQMRVYVRDHYRQSGSYLRFYPPWFPKK